VKRSVTALALLSLLASMGLAVLAGPAHAAEAVEEKGGAAAAAGEAADSTDVEVASAPSYSKYEYNCYTVWWTTAWNQRCGSGGADKAGYYLSTMECSLQSDKRIELYRGKGSTSWGIGQDCRHRALKGIIEYSTKRQT
jgi:hypothetical protein